MPHKFNASRRHKFAKKKYRVRNWGEYNESLRNRGDLTIWISPDVQNKWAAPQRESRGGQPKPAIDGDPTPRDQHIAQIHGRLAWQVSSGYNQRSRVETQMGRWKAVIGSKLKARNFENQQTEVRISVTILNQMTELGRPEFEAVI